MRTEIYSLIAAVFSAVATAFAALASWRAPITAARVAEQLRRDAQQREARHGQKLQVFTTLMQERSAIWTEPAVRALNVIDVVFIDAREVREAWAALLHTLSQQNVPLHTQQDSIRNLLSAMAADLGLAHEIRVNDLNRIYLPTPLAQERLIRDLQRQQALEQVQRLQGQPAANVGQRQGIWPPPP